MGLFYIQSATHLGLDASLVRVEIDISSGMPAFTVVGLPDAAISEARDRVRSAIRNSGLGFPRTKVTVNLAPAHVKKQGAAFDLPIAIAILAASGSIRCADQLHDSLIIGELSLNGTVRPVTGTLLAASLAKEQGLRRIIVAKENAPESCLVEGVETISIETLAQLVHYCNEQIPLPVFEPPTDLHEPRITMIDMADVRGQEHAKRALEIAAAGSHNVLLSGPPGSGKTMLARAVPSILPSMAFNEALEVTKIQSVSAKQAITGLARHRPFRSPHHSSSPVALIGGGSWPTPGEVSMAHRGVLFLDEFAEFPRSCIENLRQPLEDGFVTISRAAGTIEFPAQFMLVAAMNPCPCGFMTDPQKGCRCTASQISRYQQKISGPLLDRIDIAIEVPRIDVEKLTSITLGERSESIRARIENAREQQKLRYKNEPTVTNAELTARQLRTHCKLDDACTELLKKAIETLHLSARAYTRTLKVARTIADLENEPEINMEHLAEALQYRPKANE